MAKFLYKMQNILEVKSKMEEQAKMEYAAARIRLTEEEEKLDALQLRKAQYEQKARELLADVLDVQEIADNKAAIIRMGEFVEKQKITVRLTEEALEKARIKLQEFMQERKTHEKLREKAFDEFVKEENARESKEIDELVSYTYGLKIRSQKS